MSSGQPTTFVPELIRRQVLENPDQAALIHLGQTVSYKDFWRASLAWAQAIKAYLVDPDPVVGVLSPRGANMPAQHLGVWLAGAAYLPIDPSLPAGRIATILAEAKCEVVITTDTLAHLLPSSITTVTRPSDSATPVEPDTAASDLAYVMFTSGTTGTPKGVEIEHGNLGRLLKWHRDFFDLKPGVRTALLACIARDGLILDEWGTLSAGATLAVPEQEILSSPELIGGFLENHQVEHTYMPQAMFESFYRAGQRPAKLRSIATGSEQIQFWPSKDFTAGVYNVYGPTEATVLVTSSGDLRAENDQTRLPHVGKPIPGTEVWIEDANGAKLTEAGVEGELVIGGELVARGYRNQPELTAKAFPLSADGMRTYRTGDRAEWAKDGNINYLGRRDGQVKLGGLRAELAEIEHAILREPGVRKVIVTLLGQGDQRQLTALVEGSANEAALRARLLHELPAAMVPESITFVETLQEAKAESADLSTV